MYTVIIVDDEPIIKKSLTKLIEMRFPHFKVIGYAEDGKEALLLTEKYHPDLIITDIRMPEMDGLEFIQAVEKINRDLKIVVVSGFDEFEYAQHALRHGAIDYLLKPIKPELFYNMLEKVEKQLKKQKFFAKETREWLTKSKDSSEELIKYLWEARHAESIDFLTSSYRDMASQNIDSLIIREFYIELYKFVKVGINNKLGQELSCDALEPSENLNLKEVEIITHFKAWISLITKYIQEAKNWRSNSKVKLAAEFINTHFSDPNLTLQLVAERVDLSATYFSRQFKEEYGKSFIHYLTELRMEKAKELLIDIHLKTYEIAEMVGYNDYPHFTKTFKKYHKISPKEYRNLLSI